MSIWTKRARLKRRQLHPERNCIVLGRASKIATYKEVESRVVGWERPVQSL